MPQGYWIGNIAVPMFPKMFTTFAPSQPLNTFISAWDGLNASSATAWTCSAENNAYAHADTEQKRKTIDSATPYGSPLRSKLNSKCFTITDDETLKKLYGLKG